MLCPIWGIRAVGSCASLRMKLGQSGETDWTKKRFNGVQVQ